MSTIQLTINGQEVTGQSGQTVLDLCRASGIYIPTLCQYEGLSNVGACRLCIVEIEGQRRPVPSCTTPAADRMVIKTDTPQLEDLRRQTIELLFSERNHICPFCPRSGYCELQTAGYRSRMDHVRYDYCLPMLEMDNSHRHIALDHNRCILCTRCIRACDEWVGAHVLDMDHRGFNALLIADTGVPLGESSCVSCGTCVSVCPTGALFEKRSAHWQGRLPPNRQVTICPGCGVGCRISVSVRHRQIGEIQSAGGPSGNRVLCERGRFGLVEPGKPRVKQIAIRRGNDWMPRPLADVLADCSRRLNSAPVKADPQRVVAMISPRLPLETIAAASNFLQNVVGSNRWTLLDRTNSPAVRQGLGMNGKPVPLATLADLDEADLFLLLGCNLGRSHGVVASYVRRAALHRRARIVKINPRHTWLTDWTDLHIQVERGKDALVLAGILKYLIDMGVTNAEVPKELATRLAALDDDDMRLVTGIPGAELRRAAELYGRAERPMIICGSGLTRSGPQGMTAALNLVKAMNRRTSSGRWRLMEAAMGANSAGSRVLGDGELDLGAFDPHTAELAFVLLGDDDRGWPREWIEDLRTVTYVVAMTAREHDILDSANVVLPTATWVERAGGYLNLEGRLQQGNALMERPEACVDEIEFFQELAKAWRGPSCHWSPPGLPEGLRNLGDGHLVPCDVQTPALDFSGLEALAAD